MLSLKWEKENLLLCLAIYNQSASNPKWLRRNLILQHHGGSASNLLFSLDFVSYSIYSEALDL